MERKYLLGALEYTEKLLSLGEKTVLDIQANSIACFLESDFVGKEGVSVNTDNGDVWLRMKRLRETTAPKSHPMFDGWVSGASNNPEKPPQLNSERLVRLSKEEISELIAADRLSGDDVMKPLKDDATGKLDALLRLSSFPEFESSWQNYLSTHWNKWAELERPRRHSIALYSKLYQLHQRIVSLGEDNPIELVWGIGVALWQRETVRVCSHIIEQPVESDLEVDGTIVLRPRAVSPSINLKPFHALEIEGSEAVHKETSSILAQVSETESGLTPFEPATFHRILQTCASRLAAKGRFYPDDKKDPSDRTLPTAGPDLVITDTWLIFARTRTADIRRDDLKRLIQKVEDLKSDADIPGASRAFVRPPSNKTQYGKGIYLGNTDLELPELESGHGNFTGGNGQSIPASNIPKSSTFFFPLPYNDEQISVVKALEENDGVVVQGPPGTGKTHTIANIISHYLALGRSVLVTAKTAEALTAVQEKLPEGIRNLAISVIHNDREGARQLETAMKMLSNEAKQIDITKTEAERREKQKRIADTIRRLETITNELQSIAKSNLSKVNYRGREWMPMDLAREVTNARSLHEWFADRPPGQLDDPCPVATSDVARLRELRNSLGNDILYPTDSLPDPASLPTLGEIVAAHEELTISARVENEIQSGNVPLMELSTDADIADARDLTTFLEGINALHDVRSRSEWFNAFANVALKHIDERSPHSKRVLDLAAEWVALGIKGKEFILRQIEVGSTHPTDEELTSAIHALSAGRNPYGFVPIGKSGLKAKVAQIQIEGRAPQSKEEWVVVGNCRNWLIEVNAYLVSWRDCAADTQLPAHHETWSKAAPFIVAITDEMAIGFKVFSEIGRNKDISRRLAPYGFDWHEVFYQGKTARFLHALTVNVARKTKVGAIMLRERLKELVHNPSFPFDAELNRTISLLGDETTSVHDLARVWQIMLAEAARLAALRPALNEIDTLTAKISAAGAPDWATLLRTVPSRSESVPLLPLNWRDAWEWAKAEAFIRRISDRDRVAALIAEQTKLEADQKRLFAEVVRLRTFLGLKIKITDSIEAALNKFTAAISRLGQGTGKSAARYRRIIRNSTFEASHAIPCWIMPEWRVSEQLPPDLGLFDLVIVDEASQSDITSLPAIMRGKKILVVGDDKQVSPSTIGIEERQIIQLRTTFLQGNPYADQMDPGSSLYDLAAIVFPGKAIMLREHFRCVEPIIRFSSQFYPQPLVPLRLPTAAERIDPPLVDIFVTDGKRDARGINDAEAQIIIQEIKTIIDDPALEHRSIGIISLIGDKQAKRIYDLLLKEITPEQFARHKIMCGNAATFQGQERDIMFLSMVECPETSTTKASRIFEQRFNVAMSRARDRLYLVRSVAPENLKANDLKFKTIEHFRNPMEVGHIAMGDQVLDVCESGFEKEVGAELLKRGYRLRAQVPVAGYRLDFVVEGQGDHRLAIECDGDPYHGPDRWAEDVRRQKALERLGWIFWRVWGSHWYSDRSGCVQDLIATLDRLNIAPLGADISPFEWTEHRMVSSQSRATAAGLEEEEETIKTGPSEKPKASPFEIAEALSPARAERESSDSFANGGVKVGDFVVVRYNDTNKLRRIFLSDTENKPEDGIVHVAQPLGVAVLGAEVDDEIQFPHGKGTRSAVIERIERGVN